MNVTGHRSERGGIHEIDVACDQLCEGAASPLVLALVEGVRFTPREIEQFRQLLNQLEDAPRGPQPKR